jgi:hypothetical protein
VSAVLVRETHEGQKPVFFVSKTMDETESRYLPLEKAALALIQAAKNSLIISRPVLSQFSLISH